jgi:hypothetical protein
LQAIFEAGNDTQVKYKDKSKSIFYVWLEDNFLILPDQKTVIGVDQAQTGLIMEDITNQAMDYAPLKFGKHKGNILTLTFVEELNMLLAGDSGNELIQYEYRNNSWNVLKNYGDLGIGPVFSSVRIGGLVILGGWGTYLLRVIDLNKMQIQGDPFKTAIKEIHSLSLCRVSNSKVLLSVSGYSPSYSPNQSDILDITGLLKEHKINIGKAFSREKEGKIEDSDCETETSPKCICDGEVMLSKILAKVEYHMNNIISELVRNVGSKSESRSSQFYITKQR